MAKSGKLNPDKKSLLSTPVEPFQVGGDLTSDELLRRMEAISFQGRNLATARRVWQRMIEDEVFTNLDYLKDVGRSLHRLVDGKWLF